MHHLHVQTMCISSWSGHWDCAVLKGRQQLSPATASVLSSTVNNVNDQM